MHAVRSGIKKTIPAPDLRAQCFNNPEIGFMQPFLAALILIPGHKILVPPQAPKFLNPDQARRAIHHRHIDPFVMAVERHTTHVPRAPA